MTSVYLDTNVFLYAIATSSPYRESCRALIEALGDGRLHGEVGVGVLQELTHLLRRRAVPHATDRARDVGRMVARVHPVAPADFDRALALVEAHPDLPLADALHAAVALNHNLTVLISADADFEGIPGLRRVDPLDGTVIETLLMPTRP